MRCQEGDLRVGIYSSKASAGAKYEKGTDAVDKKDMHCELSQSGTTQQSGA